MRAILTIAVVFLVGCSSTPKPSKLISDQFCHTSKVIETQDQSVSSRVRVECSDDPTEKYLPAKTGIGKDCIVSYINMPYGREKVYACKKYDGSYDIVDSRSVR